MLKINLKLKIFVFFFCLIPILFMVRLFYLQVLSGDKFKRRAEDQVKRIIKVLPRRGSIYTRNEAPLALTKKVYSLYAIPAQITNKYVTVKGLSLVLGMKQATLFRKLNSKAPFLWIKRKLEEDVYQKILRLDLKGINFMEEEKRIYPKKNLGAHFLGFVGIDNQGLGGVEYKFDKLLSGTPGEVILESDPRGVQISSGTRKVRQSYDGGDIYATLDEFIQYSAQKHLKEGVEANQAEGGQVIVMNPNTGEVLGLAIYPDFNPNKYYEYKTADLRNKAVTDIFEPGSIFKVVTISSALEEGVVKPDSVFEVPEKIRVRDRVIKEAHARKEGDSDKKTVRDILRESLNVGTVLVSQELGKERFYKYIKMFGFGTHTKIELPAESKGIFKSMRRWNDLDSAMASFGQGIGVTSLQIATAVSVIANGGVLVKPKVVNHFITNDSKSVIHIPYVNRGRILSKKTAFEVREMMRLVVEEGTGTTAKIPGYSIAGKTGTAQKAGQGGVGYLKGKYVASFIGFFPVRNPEILILVLVDSPQKSIWGGTVAAPIFKKITLDLIDYLNMTPDVDLIPPFSG